MFDFCSIKNTILDSDTGGSGTELLDIMEQALINEDVMNSRIYQYPTSAIKLNGRKINYYDFLMSTEDPECKAAIQR